MELPARVESPLLLVTSSPADFLHLLHHTVSTASITDGVFCALVAEDRRDLVNSAAALGRLEPSRVVVETTENGRGTGAAPWEVFCALLDRRVAELLARHGARKVFLLVDLDAVFALCEASSEMMSMIYHLRREYASRGWLVAAMVGPAALPKSLPKEFFDGEGCWVFGDQTGRPGSSEIDAVAEQLALESPEFRQRFLASGRDDSEAALGLLPRVFEDARRGLLIVDRRYVIRHCSHRAAVLLGRGVAEIVGHPLSNCVDGVDLVTVRHECAKLTPGHPSQPPFVSSWRIAPGVYEPREVSIDPIRSGHQTVGYLVLISMVEPVRGPRAVYQQLKAEKAESDGGNGSEDDDIQLTEDESVSGDLHGTQITKREHEIILLILKKMTNREIADRLNVAEVTVKKHLTSIYRKLRISTRHELAVSFSRPGADSGK